MARKLHAITAAKQPRNAEGHLTLEIESIPVPLLVISRKGAIVFANDHAARLFGHEPGELAGLTMEWLVPDTCRQEYAKFIQTCFSDPADRGMHTIRALRRDGEECPVEIAIGPIASAEQAYVVVRDVTDATRIREELRAAEERFRIISEQTANTLFGVDVDNDRLIWFDDVDATTGYEPGGFPRTLTGWFQQLHPDDIARITNVYNQILEQGRRTWDFRLRIRVKDGSYRHCIDRGTVTEFVDGRPSKGIGVVIDETVEVEARQELERALAEVHALKARLEAEGQYLREEIRSKHNFEEIVGNSAELLATLEQLDRVADTNATVLLLGETGTGKELLARAIHARSKRSERPLIKVDCTTLPSGLIESELFGHEKGAFTGAHESKAGRFELADRGTIFLDEVGELPVELQPKLLRVIQNGELERLGGKGVKKVDVRVIAATNRNLRDEVRAGRFREDLYYRLNVFPVEIPPLRDRRGDIPELATFFLEHRAKALGNQVDRIPSQTMEALIAYDWPGNIRELQNVVERAIILSRGRDLIITESLVPFERRPRQSSGVLRKDLENVERKQILDALEACDWRIKGERNAADRLGFKPSTLRSRMKRLGIERRSDRSES